MKKYRVAVVGLGRMGSTLGISVAAAAQASDRLELVAGADILPDRRSDFTETWGIKAVYEDYLKMVEAEQPDLVAVCTTATGVQKPGRRAPSKDFRQDMHAEMATAVANAGVPMLFVEKALACSMQAADGVLEACRRSGAILNTGVLLRFNHRYQMVRDAIKRGVIGEPTTAVAYTRSNTLMHMHVHSIDMLSFLLGDPGIKAARGELLPRGLKIENNRLEEDPRSTYQIVFNNEVEAWSVPAGPRDFEIIGTEGSIRAMSSGKGAMLRKPESGGEDDPAWFETLVPSADGMMTTQACLEDLVDALESKRPSLGNVEVTHNITEALLAIAESHRRGGAWVQLPIENRDLYIFHV